MKPYNLKDKDKLTLTGKQLREFKQKVIQEERRRILRIMNDIQSKRFRLGIDVWEELEKAIKNGGKNEKFDYFL